MTTILLSFIIVGVSLTLAIGLIHFLVAGRSAAQQYDDWMREQ